MRETIGALIDKVLLYNNDSYLFLLFLAALLLLWITEKGKKLKLILVYFVLAITAIFLCPFYAWIGMKVDAAIYYRVFWSLPIGILVCYSAVKMISRCRWLILKVAVFLFTVAVIILNGKFVYKNTLHFKASNEYHIPQQVIDVAEALKLERYKPIAVMPAELLLFFRQYTADVYTPYGRNVLEPTWAFPNELYDAMEGDSMKYDIAEVTRCARNEQCAFVVLSSAKQMEGSMLEHGYFLLDFVQGYYIYMDYNYYWVFKEQGLLDEDVLEAGG